MKPNDSTKSVLQKSSEIPEQTQFCIKDQDIAQFYEDTSSDSKHKQVLYHLMDCDYCQHRIGMLARLEADETELEVPEHLLASAKQMGRDSSRHYLRGPPAWAAAAAVVLALYMLAGFQPTNPPQAQAISNDSLEKGSATRQLRSVDQPLSEPRILTPKAGATIDPHDLVIKWTEMPGSLHYDLYILSDDGELIFEQRVNDTQWSGDKNGLFAGGFEYYARVEGQFSDNRSISTNHVLFRVEENK